MSKGIRYGRFVYRQQFVQVKFYTVFTLFATIVNRNHPIVPTKEYILVRERTAPPYVFLTFAHPTSPPVCSVRQSEMQGHACGLCQSLPRVHYERLQAGVNRGGERPWSANVQETETGTPMCQGGQDGPDSSRTTGTSIPLQRQTCFCSAVHDLCLPTP